MAQRKLTMVDAIILGVELGREWMNPSASPMHVTRTLDGERAHGATVVPQKKADLFCGTCGDELMDHESACHCTKGKVRKARIAKNKARSK